MVNCENGFIDMEVAFRINFYLSQNEVIEVKIQIMTSMTPIKTIMTSKMTMFHYLRVISGTV